MKLLLRTIAALGAFATLVWIEKRHPLRKARENKTVRNFRNAAVAALSAVVVEGVERPLVLPLAKRVPAARLGLLQRLPLPPVVRSIAGLLLLDYTLYIWHLFTHRLAILWRFHAVHHVDLDMDASTALRFHFGEMLLSVPFRAAQVVLLGIDGRTLTRWQKFVIASILFHHSNIRIPFRFEKKLSYLIVTPRMHGLHHDSDPERAAANWSSGLSVWDILHGTYAMPDENRVSIGVSGLHRKRQLRLRRLLTMPFRPPKAVIKYLRRSRKAQSTA